MGGDVTEKWHTYERIWSGSLTVITQPESEKAPRMGGWVPRPATKREIKTEIAKRKEKDIARKAQVYFEARQDYKDAKAIHDTLEFMGVDGHPLDRLTPAEWSELRRRLTA